MLISFTAAQSWSASPFEGKTVKIVCGYDPGSGYDRMSRLLAKHLPKYIPGKPVFVVENMPGAATIVAANYIYNIAKPDGLTVGTFDRSLPFAQLRKAEGVKFDLAKYSWVGSMASEATVLIIGADTPFKTFDDLRKSTKPIYIGATGPTAPGATFVALAKTYIGLNIQFVMYTSSGAEELALQRKEVYGRGGSYTSNRIYIERGTVRVLLRPRINEPALEKVPIDEDMTDNPLGKTLMAMRTGSDRIGRPFVAPPNTPPDVMNILRDGFAKVAKDPEALAEANKVLMKVEYTPADECIKVINYILTQPDNVVKEFEKLIKF